MTSYAAYLIKCGLITTLDILKALRGKTSKRFIDTHRSELGSGAEALIVGDNVEQADISCKSGNHGPSWLDYFRRI